MNKFQELLLNRVPAEKHTALKEIIEGINFDELYQPQIDSAVSKGVESNKKKLLETDIKALNEIYFKERIKKDYPELDESTKEVRELRKQIEDMQANTKRITLLNLIEKAGLPKHIKREALLGEDEESTAKNIATFLEENSKYIEEIKKTTEEDVVKRFATSIPKASDSVPKAQHLSATEMARKGDTVNAIKQTLSQKKE